MSSPAVRTLHLRFKGRVQGVCFRVQSRDRARELGLTGWVRNLENGEVEAMASGSETLIEEWVNWCCDSLRWARVDELSREWVTAEPFDSFEIR